jgi:hypothetical protein
VVPRRLTKVELNYTVRDLMGSRLRPADQFPEDESDHGFDTNRESLAVSPLHVDLANQATSELVAELFARAPNDPVRIRVLGCAAAGTPTDDCLRQVLSGFARKAFRRPLAGDEIGRLLGVMAKAKAAGATGDEPLRTAFRAVLMSPHFLFHVERDPVPRSSNARLVAPHELANRLSYFLWSTMPDDPLVAAADRLGTDAAELRKQVQRMLEDERASQGLGENFVGQWWRLRALAFASPDDQVFPSFSEAILASFRRESELFFQQVLRMGLPLDSLVTADFTFTDPRLRKHYGLPDAGGDGMVRSATASTERRGVLGQGGVLTLTSYPGRTSPVKRGDWVLRQLLCTPPPPPPDNAAVEGFSVAPAQTLRQSLEAHRRNPECAACHALFDSIGFGLENFDAVGAFRVSDHGKPIDAAGAMPDGRKFSGARELATVLATDPRFVPCVTEQVLTYAVGRGFVSPEARSYVKHVADKAIALGGTLPAVIAAVVSSEAFVTRRGEPE